MNRFAPLWNRIVYSSLWEEPDYVCKVFITMLAVKDADHVVRFEAYGIKKLSNQTLEQVEEALKILSAPDRRKKNQANDGRRIERVKDGWLMLNGAYYQELMIAAMRRSYKAEWARKAREKKMGSSRGKGASGREQMAEGLRKKGDEAGAKRIEGAAGVDVG